MPRATSRNPTSIAFSPESSALSTQILFRYQLTLPISLNPKITDEILFSDPKNTNQKLYLPRYRIATELVSGQQQYRIALSSTGLIWPLTIYLEAYSAPTIELDSHNVRIIPHQAQIQLTYQHQGKQHQLNFQEVSQQSNGQRLKAVLQLHTLEERDSVYQAMTQREMATALSVHRQITVAIPIPTEETPQPAQPTLPKPTVYPDEGFLKTVQALMVDALTEIPLLDYSPYQAITQTFDDVLDDTFFFPEKLYSYIFRNLLQNNNSSGLIRKQIQWQGKYYRYYQDEIHRHIFYYLPESFEIGKQGDSQAPSLSFHFKSPDGSSNPETMLVKLQYHAVPVVNPDRLTSAAQQLMDRGSITLPPDVTSPEFIPLQKEISRFNLAIPEAIPNDNQTSKPSLHSNTKVSLQDGIFGTLLLSIKDFQSLWDALFSQQVHKTLFTGQVEVEAIANQLERIPFKGRLKGDQETLFSTMLDANVSTTYSKTIEVRTSKKTFEAPSDHPQDQIQTILVDFEQSDTVEVTANQLIAQAQINLPLSDFILHREDKGKYRYKVKIVRASGECNISDWHETTMEIVYPEIPTRKE